MFSASFEQFPMLNVEQQGLKKIINIFQFGFR